MVDCRSGKAETALAAIAGLVAACASPEDPFTSGPAHAAHAADTRGRRAAPPAAAHGWRSVERRLSQVARSWSCSGISSVAW